MIFSMDKRKKDSIAVISQEGTVLTYGQLISNMQEFGNAVQRAEGNVVHNDESVRSLLFCFCENRPEALVGYLGSMECGAVPLLLDAGIEAVSLKRLLDVYHPTFVWVNENGKKKLQELGWCGDVAYRFGDYELIWREDAQAPHELHAKLALLLATSGSTGSPKLVRLSRRNLESNAAAIAEYLKITEDERPITTLPMQYTYGLSVINSHLYKGACILMTTKSVVQQEFWDFLEQERATSLAGVPYTYQILKRMRIFQRNLPSVKTMTQAGGHLSAELQQQFAQWCQEKGIDFFVMYGQTEATARMSYLPPQECLNKIGSIGIPIPDGSFSIRDGELIYRGANVSLGEAQQKEDLAKGDERHGVLETGDLAYRDADGYYFVTGRKKRFVKIYGVRVSLDACEDLLQEYNSDYEYACVGNDDKICVYVAGGCEQEKVCEEMLIWLADQLHLSMRVFCGVHLAEIPKTASGKTAYGQLQMKKGSKNV